MTKYKEARRLRISWTRPVTFGSPPTGEFVDKFKLRMKLEHRSVTVIDPLQAGTAKTDVDFLKNNEYVLSDYMVVSTLDYLQSCCDEAEHEFLSVCLLWLRDGVRVRFWTVCLEQIDLKRVTIGNGNCSFRPWKQYKQWHFLPPDRSALEIVEKRFSKEVDKKFLQPFIGHAKNCSSCNGDQKT